jgi:hypothetical protein
MKPKHSLNHNIKSVPLVLTRNTDEEQITEQVAVPQNALGS